MKVMICGGGTGGHVYPALAVVQALKDRGFSNDQFLWVGTHGQMEEDLVPRAGLALRTIAGGPIAGVPRIEQVKNGTKLMLSVGSGLRLIGEYKPNVLFFTGGYVNLPVALAGWLRRIPSAVYLPDVEPGAAIRRIEPFIQKIGATADGSKAFLPNEKLVVTGYPVRKELRSALDLSVGEARSQFGLASDKPTLFVFGGSRGAQSINRSLMAILPTLLEKVQVIHVSGTLTWPEVEAFEQTLSAELRANYRPKPYLHEEMGAAFRAADLVVARAGASMLGECPAFGLPAILVPYPHAWRYQKVNADFLVDQGAGIRIDDETMAEKLLPEILEILENTSRLDEMKQAAKALDKPLAAADLADMLIGLAK